MRHKFVIGLDFGTKSGRALLVDAKSGEIIAQGVKEYPHGVMDIFLPDGTTRLGTDWALQHPQDYIDVLEYTILTILAPIPFSKPSQSRLLISAIA
jgi:L-ribulokinase